ncbi:hypothetical protein MMC25_001142 [Agyrium rufum]|nr:hypothetical protein [Agyrium rufum]
MDGIRLLQARQNGESGSGDPGQTFLNDIEDPFRQQANASSIWIALGVSLGTMVVITLIFSVLRPHNSVVYAPKLKHADKKHAPPPIGNGLFAWIAPVVRTTEAQIVDKVGMDAAVFLRFTRMCRNIMLVLSLLGCGILIPTHVILANSAITPQNLSAVAKAFALMTPQYVQGAPLWAHVVCSWLFDLVIISFLWINWRAVARLRRHYFESAEYQNSLHSRSLMMTDIPPKDRSDEGILRICDAVEQTAGIPRAAIARNVKEVPELIDQHSEAVRELESVLAKYLKNPDRLPAKRPLMTPFKADHREKRVGKVDSIDYLTRRIRDLEMEIKEARESIDKRNAMPYGFATYEHIEEAHTVAFAARKRQPHDVVIRLAPKPNDLIWKNLPLSKQTRAGRRLVNNLWVVLLTLVWIVPNALIAIFLTSLANLAAVWPGFKKSFDGHPTLWSTVQAIAAPALTSLVYLFLPIIFRRLSIRGGDTTKTSREMHVTRSLYNFFVFNNLIVFSCFSAIWAYVSLVIQYRRAGHSVGGALVEANFAYRIMVALCTVSPFWVNWLLQRNLGAAADLAQVITLSWVWFSRTFLAPTPRQTIEWTAPPPFDYASYYNYFLFYTTVSICYATLQPIVLPVAALYFVVDSWLKKYLLLYVFITKTESGGQFWNIVFNRMLVATVIANLVSGLVIRAAQGTWTMVFCIVPLPFIILAFKLYCRSAFENQSKYYTKANITLQDPEAFSTENGVRKHRRPDRVGVKFGHPALYKPLITPMVHAKAQHVLPQIYRGRMDIDGANTGDYSDIAMDPMSQSQPGKLARFAPMADPRAAAPPDSLFEVVPEGQLDFAYFKNRAEFGDEHGGEGELYGRPLDLVTERSHTPASYVGSPPYNRTGSGFESRSRSASPAPSYAPVRQQRAEELRWHPAYREQNRQFSSGDIGANEIYKHDNESERGLLKAGDPHATTESRSLASADEGDADDPGVYTVDRWRTGVTQGGYVNVPAQGAGLSGDDEMDYDRYRSGGRRAAS